MLTYDTQAISRLEKAYSTPQIIDQRRRLRGVVAARPGEVGLDLGCGVAYLACELAKDVAPNGRIVAVDSSSEAVDDSRARIAQERLTSLIDVRLGNAAELPFPNETFDFVVGAQVFCYVPDIARAIGEAARVLRKGGRLVVLDSDWDMCIWASGDPALARRIINARGAAQFAHAYLPRELHGLMRAAGMTLSDVQSFSIIEPRYTPDSFSVSIIPSTRDAALKRGIPAEEVARWEKDLRSRTSEGQWFFCLNRFVFTATK